jgi:hypothetical protein
LGQTGSRPAALKDLGFASTYVFGAVCPDEGKAAAVILLVIPAFAQGCPGNGSANCGGTPSAT